MPTQATAAPATLPRRKGAGRYDNVTFRACKPAESFADWKGVWVIVEHRDGKLRDVTLELLGAARPMADKLGQKVTAVILGHQVDAVAQQLARSGADTWPTSMTLAAGIKKISALYGDVDIICFGEETTDASTGQVGPGVAG
ncbi:MAG TPA: hypothetical protein VHI93_05650, partial [Candidatus Thermoplasmatota archaeon]|nr:hypothetical protein [Candidatus Thermoplasmatota archaeon]